MLVQIVEYVNNKNEKKDYRENILKLILKTTTGQRSFFALVRNRNKVN